MHNPSRIQPGAYVVVLDPDLRIQALSENVSHFLGGDAGAVVGGAGSSLFSESTLERLGQIGNHVTPYPFPLSADGPVDWGELQCIPHRHGRTWILEIEPRSPQTDVLITEIGLRDINDAILSSSGTLEMLEAVCRNLTELFGFDRTIVYELEPEGTGLISVEVNNDVFPRLRGMHFRQDDFAEKARKCYSRESVLVTGGENQEPVTIVGEAEAYSEVLARQLGCRPPFPVLARYAREGRIATVASVAIFNQEKLWGVIFAHSKEPIRLDYQLRTFLHLVGNLTSQALSYRVFNQNHRKVVASDYIRAKLRENIATASSLVEGLHHSDPSLLDVIPDTTGAVILLEGRLATIGSVPPEEDVRKLLTWAADQVDSRGIYRTHCLESSYPAAREFRKTAAGLLLAPLNASRTEWIAWFRAEKVEEVVFGSLSAQNRSKSHPRFVSTVETRRGCSQVWSQTETDAAHELQIYIRDVVMEKYSQLSRVNYQLQQAYDEMQSFSYTVSHDLRAPLRGIDGFAEIFIEDYGTVIDSQGKALIQTIQQNAARMNQYIADILELSRVGRSRVGSSACDVQVLVREALSELSKDMPRPVEVTVSPDLPPLKGDPKQLTLVFYHLLSNAIKYSKREDSPRILVGHRPVEPDGPGEFFVSDNGIGIAPLHQERIFGMFNRLVTHEDFAGNGVGLAIVRRIIAKHGGSIRVESEVGQGATFLFRTNPQD